MNERETHRTSFVIFREVLWNPAYTRARAHTHTHTHTHTYLYSRWLWTVLCTLPSNMSRRRALPVSKMRLPSRCDEWIFTRHFAILGGCAWESGSLLFNTCLAFIQALTLSTAISSTVHVLRKLRPNADKSPPLRPLPHLHRKIESRWALRHLSTFPGGLPSLNC